MRVFFVIFLLLALTILFLGHLFVYLSFNRFFQLSAGTSKILAIILGLLSVSFIIASILAHWWENWLTRSIYFLSGVWLGTLLALIVALAAVWLIRFVGSSVGLNLPDALLGALAVVASLVYVAYGIWSSGHPIVKELSVAIPNLPESWRGKTIIQLSDVHLGLVHQPDFARRVIAQANGRQPELVVITGDFFDGMDGDLDALAGPINDIEAPAGVYFVTGNHETYLGINETLAALAKTKAKVLRDESVNLAGLTLVGIDYPVEFDGKKDVPALLARLDVKRPSLLLYHEPRQIEAIAKTGRIDLMLSGHTHNGQLWPIKYISRLVYGIYVTGLHRLNDFSQYTSTGVGTWGPPLRTGSRPEIVAITLK